MRTLDALHLAGAIEGRADLFISSDKRQLAAASAFSRFDLLTHSRIHTVLGHIASSICS